MGKQEVKFFKNRYIYYLKNNNSSSNFAVCQWLENAVDFERPDGYYFDGKTKLLVIFEHFEIDCSERPEKKGKPLGSILHKNYIDKHKEVQKEIQASDDYYVSTKIIEQGYYEQNGNNRTYHIGQNGDKYRNNFINNFYESFKNHSSKIKEYINKVIEELKIQPLSIKVCFLVEDKTLGGSYYLNDENFFGFPVVLTDTLQFQEMLNNSNVDYVIFGRQQDNIASIGCKGDSEVGKIDLMKKEFFIIPAFPLFTASKKN